MKISIILGTRPEIIKMSAIIKECKNQGLNFFILHTNQHYSKKLDSIFFRELELPQPRYALHIGSGTHAEEIGKMLISIERVLLREKPDIVLVEGDTNTVLAGALASAKLQIRIGHIEAGLRSRDRRMPEEINRILTDHLADFLFAPTPEAKNNLLLEGIAPEKIFVTGNTIVDAVYQNMALAQKKSKILKKIKVEPKKYFLLTLHREENVDDRKRLKNILQGIAMVYKKFQMPIIFPIHPRTKKRLKEFTIKLPLGIITIPPVGYLDFLLLEKQARLILTDSGGVQEEACILKTPCVTLRENTERPETIKVGSNILGGIFPEKILLAAETMINQRLKWKNPFGSGRSAQKIIQLIKDHIDD